MLNKEQTQWVAGQNTNITLNLATGERAPLLLQPRETELQRPAELSTQSGCIEDGHTVCPDSEQPTTLSATAAVSAYQA